MSARRPGGERRRGDRLRRWIPELLIAAKTSFLQLWHSAGASAMTLAAISIALTLPATLFTTLDNADRASRHLRYGTSLAAYLDPVSGSGTANELANQLQRDQRIANVRAISPDDGLRELFARTGVSPDDVLFEENPLPAVLVIQPTARFQSPDAIETLVAELEAVAGVDQVRADLDWVRRIEALLQIARRAVLTAGTLLGLMVLLVVGNTIRLDIENRREEIIVCKLVGATNAFVRRPLLFGGLWLGVLGGFGAWLLTTLSIAFLEGPVVRFTAQYDAAFSLSGPGWSGLGDLLFTGAILGWLGAWLAVGRHLRTLEPS